MVCMQRRRKRKPVYTNDYASYYVPSGAYSLLLRDDPVPVCSKINIELHIFEICAICHYLFT